jgi:hypothetical protein
MCAAQLEAVQDIKISITSPHDNAEVDRPARTEGIVSHPDAQVHIIVHPVGVPEYWVQPRASVHEDGKWTTMVYLGRPDINNPDKQYELMAIADPEKPVKVGDMLKKWPSSKWRSNIIRVKRRPSTNSNYYVQVGTWRTYHFAQDVIIKLKKFYPQAYMISSNDLTKVMIPGIETTLQGKKIIKDIESKFNLKPILKLIK